MYVWEMIAHRLKVEGWNIWHTTCRDACGQTHVVHLYRPGAEWQTSGPTLTEAFAEAARVARGPRAPHVSLVTQRAG
ncbi:MAG TPA: hypothetical protein VG406_20555 [Isosphaeraceae bacterium]|jgi:hypothetical protein|nr:hypothetical protein [Isosphaeraceae bacterium]